MKRTGIITRTLDRPVLLERTLRSILAQTCQDWEWLIVTPDPALSVSALLEKHSPALAGRARVLPFRPSEPGKRGQPLNHALAHSDTEFVTVLDDDDTWHPDYLASMLRLLESPCGQSAGGAVCQTQVIEESTVAEGLQPIRGYVMNPHLRSVTLPQLSIVNQFCIHAFLYRRSALALSGLYPEDYPVLEDWIFNLNFLRHYDIAVLPDVLTFYHQRPGVLTGPDANSLFAELDLHKFYESKFINGQIRGEWRAGGSGPGSLAAAGAHIRLLQERIHQMESKIKTISEKTGKIDARTRELKSALLKGK
ncbi:MAG: glycosyl transferase [Verrucomicrobiales bacterium]|nr:glycosyl transferase [Verrucomicrobiales bacterium]